ncbi:hypothetical protein [Rubrivivax gelatinosus]|nr:hypothetical protein [Rubrivivax gelatinosus]
MLGWTEDQVRTYVDEKPLATGDHMIVLNEYGGFRSYQLVEVVNPALGRQRRILVSQHQQPGGQTFYRNGKNCFYPKGRTKMIPPTPSLAPFLQQPGDQVELRGIYGIVTAQQPPQRLRE